MNSRGSSFTELCAFAACGAAVLALLAHPALAQGPDLAALVQRIPDADPDGKHTGPSPEEAQMIYDAVLKGGKDSIVQLVGMLAPPGEGEDYKARYVLHGLAIHVGRPGAEAQRRMLGDALISTLGGGAPTDVKRFVIQELQFLGESRAVEPIGAFLLDEALCDDAAMALVAMKKGAAPVLARALPDAPDRCRLAIIQALGEVRDSQSVPALIRALDEGPNDHRLAAAVALSKIGDPRAVEPMLRAAAAAGGHPRIEVCNACFTLAENLMRAGAETQAAQVYRGVWKALPAQADPQLRYVVVEGLAVSLRSQSTTDLARQLRTREPATRAAIVHVLGQRGDAAAFDAIAAAMRDEDPGVRFVAISAVGPVGRDRSIPVLVGALPGESPEAAQALWSALLMVQGENVNDALAAGLADVREGPQGSASRILLLDIVTRRQAAEAADEVFELTSAGDADVRVRALRAIGALGSREHAPPLVERLSKLEDADELKAVEDALVGICVRIPDQTQRLDALVEPLARVDVGSRCALVRVVGRIGTEESVSVLLQALEDGSAEVRDAAMQSLADFPNDRAAPHLLEIAKTTENTDHRKLAVSGYVRLAEEQRSADRTLAMLREAMGAASMPPEKRQVLGSMSNIATPDALMAVVSYLPDPDLTEAAGKEAIAIVRKLKGRPADTIKQALQQVLEHVKTEDTRNAANGLLAGL